MDGKMVVVYPRGQLSNADRRQLEKHGIIALEADDPSKVVTVLPIAPCSSPVQADDMTMAALHAVRNSSDIYTPQAFVRELYRRTLLRESGRAAAVNEGGEAGNG
jgi:hypothetical protein